MTKALEATPPLHTGDVLAVYLHPNGSAATKVEAEVPASLAHAVADAIAAGDVSVHLGSIRLPALSRPPGERTTTAEPPHSTTPAPPARPSSKGGGVAVYAGAAAGGAAVVLALAAYLFYRRRARGASGADFALFWNPRRAANAVDYSPLNQWWGGVSLSSHASPQPTLPLRGEEDDAALLGGDL